ncbi:DUF3352 domain-containing protein [Pseudanabaena sp. PCC 6802]|uniref:DUF3352 domain-containing protein n=1 Tax=Pseudanabaena sp. PCC 6802 TaxID=118173 RepID=UPI0003469E2D|nr:DUF3352 domain-containing protein [Pseudanabaena sp. PCC 6802]
MTKSDRPTSKPTAIKKKKTPRKKKTPVLLIGGISAAAMAAGSVAGYFFLTRSQNTDSITGIATVIPQDAQVAIAFNTKREPWQKLNQFGTPESQKLLKDSMQQSPLGVLLSQSQTDFSKDVQPWLGGEAVMALVSDPQKPNSPPGTLVIASTNDSSQSEAFLAKYRNALTKQGAKFSPKEYKDLRYFESPTRERGRTVVTADIGGRYIAIATSPELIKKTFDTYKGEKPSLAKKTNFTNVFGAERRSNINDPLVQMYLDGSIALEFIGSNAKVSLSQPVVEASRKQIDAITLAVGTQKEGIRMELSIYPKNDSNLNQQANDSQNGTSSVTSKLPQETFLLISGNNLQRSWQEITAQAKSNPSSAQATQQIRKAVKDATQLDLEKDILKWMTGEFAIAAIPADRGLLANPGFGLVVLMQTSDRNATTKMLTKLDRLAESSVSGAIPQGVEVKSKQLASKQIVTWNIGTSTVASHGFIDDTHAFWAMGDLSETLIPSPSKKLPDSSDFQVLTAGLPKNNGGYFYLNMENALTIAEKLLPSDAKTSEGYAQTKALLNAIRGIAVTNTTIDNRITRLDFLFTLKPVPGN